MEHLNFDCVEPVAYTVDEFARLIHCRRRDVRDMISSGRLKCITDGIRPRIPVSEVRRLIDEQFIIEVEARKDIAQLRGGLDKKDGVEPEPYTVKEFARRILRRRQEVVEMMSRGDLSCVSYGSHLKIPIGEMRRLVYKSVDDGEGVARGIALAIRNGIVEEIGPDKDGNMIFRTVRS